MSSTHDDALDALMYSLQHRPRVLVFYGTGIKVPIIESLHYTMLTLFWLTLLISPLIPLDQFLFFFVGFASMAMGTRGWLQKRARDCGGYWYAGHFQDPL